ncbi:response regulator, partial [Vibrio harveyi]
MVHSVPFKSNWGKL